MGGDNTNNSSEAAIGTSSGSNAIMWGEITQRIYMPSDPSEQMIPRRATIDENGVYHPCPMHDHSEMHIDSHHFWQQFIEKPARQEARERAAAVAETAIAASNGDMGSLQNSVRDAFQKIGGDPDKFKKYAADLQKELEAEGIDVRFSGNTLAFHRQGEPLAVEFQLQSGPGDLNTSVRAQPYDWHSKKDVQGEDPNRIVSGFTGNWRDQIPSYLRLFDSESVKSETNFRSHCSAGIALHGANSYISYPQIL